MTETTTLKLRSGRRFSSASPLARLGNAIARVFDDTDIAGGMKMRFSRIASDKSWLLVSAVLLAALAGFPQAYGQQGSPNANSASASEKPYVVEWVYKVKWGHADEYWQIFKKYQIAVLNREKQLGYVTSYTVYRPGLHTGEDTRWEFTIIINYKNQAAAGHGEEVTKQLFPDQQTLKREENHRWELVEAHWDLPIRPIDPNGDGTD
jgi:hypothetical protein